ncbi:PilZ domain-containing protein [Wenzhouxiangella limi]|uniref:PilZ domain-containing protein n=1 Tax=Wenzhouxiangella limi TaxID=2707351 RepID=A0A845UVG9_9GAMM|nr:PilZ domain-containing protein [Wenzhouxiangella limi]NDY95823.1 PilZ domain-containing protein [Wenzhouxiangella limi]
MVQDQERRSFHRFPFEGRGLLSVGNVQRVHCGVIDVSINGALLELQEPVEFGTGASGELGLILRGRIRQSQVDLEFSIEVVWQKDQVLGCRFMRVDPETFEQLKIFVADNLGDTALLDRELTKLGYWPGVGPSSVA